MYIRSFGSVLFHVLLPLALIATTYLYLYPVFHGCAFPSTTASVPTAFQNTLRLHGWLHAHDETGIPRSLAPFRLLALADPQLEGDSSLPKPEDALTRRVAKKWTRLRNAPRSQVVEVLEENLIQLVRVDVVEALQALRKRVDLFGNDYYLAHIYRTLHWWSKPTHVTVLGDLIGSQWVTDDEFEWRGWRYWNRVLAGGRRIEDDITRVTDDEEFPPMGMVDESWKSRVINIAGNHDIGYAGDISEERLKRYEKVFGKANWDIRLKYTTGANETTPDPTLHLIVLNSLNLDGPALSEEGQHDSYNFVNTVITKHSAPVEDQSSFTLLLTHLPLHKERGVCVDSPFFDYWGDDDGGGVYRPHGLREQNHLGEHVSQGGILEGIYGISGDQHAAAAGRGRTGLILNGHDHEGCDVWHHASYLHDNEEKKEQTARTHWQASNWAATTPTSRMNEPGLREVTLRSMMGEYGGNAGLLSIWFDFESRGWKYDIQMCRLGVQHIWWAIHLLDMVTLSLGVVWMSLNMQTLILENLSRSQHAPIYHRRVKAVKRD